jgi:hypothetical protein
MARQTKIVKISNITQFADFMARSIRARLKWSKQLRKSVVLGEAEDKNGVVSIPIYVGVGVDKSGNPLTGMALAYEYGSGNYRTKGSRGTYKILPKNARALWFPYPSSKVYPGTKTYTKEDGQFGITSSEVDHPGVEKNPFIAPAKREAIKRALPELKLQVRNNIKESLLVSIRQVGK